MKGRENVQSKAEEKSRECAIEKKKIKVKRMCNQKKEEKSREYYGRVWNPSTNQKYYHPESFKVAANSSSEENGRLYQFRS